MSAGSRASATASRPAMLGGVAQIWTTILATAVMSFRRSTAYLINIIRIPLGPLAIYAVAYFAYQASGRELVGGVNVPGFLLIGMFGHVTITAAVWEAGSAIENERFEGTIAALFLSPASRIAVIFGHGLGGLLFLIPSFAVVALLGFVTGADLDVADPLAVTASAVTLILASLSLGFLLATFFILTRRANLMANVIQHPLYLLGGLTIPRQQLPDWLYRASDALPIAHAVDAFRASTLAAASINDIGGTLLAGLGTSAACLLLGILGLRRVEYAAKRSGQLDLF